jgi:magnesium/cobalt transport protein CorA
MAKRIDLLDPDRAALEQALPAEVESDVVARLLAPVVDDDEPRPRIASRRTYVFGIYVVPLVIEDENRVCFQEVDFVLTRDAVVTVRKTPPGGRPFDADDVLAEGPAGEIAASLADAVAERFLDAIEALDDEVDEVDDGVEELNAAEVRGRIRSLRQDLLRVRRVIGPTREALHKVIDKRIDLEGAEAFPHDVEVLFGDAYDKLLRAVDGLDLARDLLAGARDYLQAKVSNEQNEVMKRLTLIASLLLVPTFIVGLYGQNFQHHFPEIHWQYGYAWSWGLIILTTIGQLIFFRKKRWL